MINYSDEKFNLIKSYVESLSDDRYYEYFEDRNDIIMTIDWREFDEDIVDYCKSILEIEDLSVITNDADNKQGFETILMYKKHRLCIPYEGEGADRDTTIIYLNEILHPDYEIRLCIISLGNDTLEFLPLPTENWKALENEFKENVDRLFQKINKQSLIFGK